MLARQDGPDGDCRLDTTRKTSAIGKTRGAAKLHASANHKNAQTSATHRIVK